MLLVVCEKIRMSHFQLTFVLMMLIRRIGNEKCKIDPSSSDNETPTKSSTWVLHFAYYLTPVFYWINWVLETRNTMWLRKFDIKLWKYFITALLIFTNSGYRISLLNISELVVRTSGLQNNSLSNKVNGVGSHRHLYMTWTCLSWFQGR